MRIHRLMDEYLTYFHISFQDRYFIFLFHFSYFGAEIPHSARLSVISNVFKFRTSAQNEIKKSFLYANQSYQLPGFKLRHSPYYELPEQRIFTLRHTTQTTQSRTNLENHHGDTLVIDSTVLSSLSLSLSSNSLFIAPQLQSEAFGRLGSAPPLNL